MGAAPHTGCPTPGSRHQQVASCDRAPASARSGSVPHSADIGEEISSSRQRHPAGRHIVARQLLRDSCSSGRTGPTTRASSGGRAPSGCAPNGCGRASSSIVRPTGLGSAAWQACSRSRATASEGHPTSRRDQRRRTPAVDSARAGTADTRARPRKPQRRTPPPCPAAPPATTAPSRSRVRPRPRQAGHRASRSDRAPPRADGPRQATRPSIGPRIAVRTAPAG